MLSQLRGRSADALFLDEVREWSEEGYRAAMPVTRARPNAHTFLTSNAGDAFSTVLNGLRERALDNPPKTFGYYEYSAPQYCKIDDPKSWALANPALGYLVTKETLEESVATSPIENTRTELLCQWIDSLSRRVDTQSMASMSRLLVAMPRSLLVRYCQTVALESAYCRHGKAQSRLTILKLRQI